LKTSLGVTAAGEKLLSSKRTDSGTQETGSQILQKIRPKGPSHIILRLSSGPTVDILNGNRFMVSSREGDIGEDSHGLFRDDTRFLSTYNARINGKGLTTLTSNNTTHYSSAFYLTNQEMPSVRAGPNIPKEALAIHRRRFIEEDVREEFFVTNVCKDDLDLVISFELDADFADLFEVKSRVFGKKPDMLQEKALKMGGATRREVEEGDSRSNEISRKFLKEDNAFDFSWTDPRTGFRAQTLVWFSRRGKVELGDGQRHARISFDISLKPQETRRLTVVVVMLINGEKRLGRYTSQYFQKQEQKVENTLRKWNLNIPRLETNWDEFRHAYYQSLIDIVSLRMTDPTGRHDWDLIAAGCPWFVTLFGRDTLITSYQSALFGGDLAKGAIEGLSEYQSKQLNDNRDEQPGKIIHELRFGDYAARSERFPYYGTADATPLFLIVASEIYRWTHDIDFVNKHRQNIMDALMWIDKYGDFDRDGFVEYIKRTKSGLDNQCWKDSWNSIQYSNGKIAEAPIATCEVQGYVYDAKLRIAEIASGVWKDSSLAKKLVDEANELKERFNEKFWIEDKGYYALALDKDKKQVDSMTSNNGQLFWSGIVNEDKAGTVIEKLMDNETMFSGYGIRTMSRKDKGYSPIGYHTGCVWAHDNSLIAEGLARYGRKREAKRVICAVLSAAPHFGYTFPETFAGFSKLETGFPVRYPTSCQPQAWAAGSPLLFLRTMLGLHPSQDGRCITIDSLVDLEYEDISKVERSKGVDLELCGIKAFDRKYCIEIHDGSKPRVYEE